MAANTGTITSTGSADVQAGPGQGRLFPATCSHVYGSEHCTSGRGRSRSVPTAQVALTVLADAPQWVAVGGGVLRAHRWQAAATVEDLEWMQTPVTVAIARRAHGLITNAGDAAVCNWCWSSPVTGISWKHATELASLLAGRLPTSPEWEWMAGRGVHRYPWGDDEPHEADRVERANIREVGPDTVTPVGAFPAGATADGLLDVAGNVWEWTATAVPSGFVIRGGSYRALPLYARCDFVNEVPASLISPGVGLRVVRDR